ncbi:MAG: PorV/PorQ family protein [bacterium]
MKKIFAVLLLICGIVTAQDAGNNGLSFLKFSFGAKNAALADLGVVLANDVTALNYNPALLAGVDRLQLHLTHNQSIQDVKSEMFGFGFSFNNINFAVGVNTSTVSDIEIRNTPGEAIAKFDANYFYGSLSSGFYLTDNLSAGLTFKYLYEGMLTDEATGYGLDFGFAYKSIIPNLNMAVALRNIGKMNKLRNQSTELPKDLRFGSSYLLTVDQIKSNVVLAAGFNKYLEEEDLHYSVAADIKYDNLFSLRVGYITGYDSKGITTGFGIDWNNFNIDYAFTPYNYDLGDVHTISLMYNF